MTGKFERVRLADLRNQLRDDLELYLMLQQAREDDVDDLPELIRIAHAALQQSARAYREAGASISGAPHEAAAMASAPASRTARASSRVEPSAPEMSTEELMKLFDDEPK